MAKRGRPLTVGEAHDIAKAKGRIWLDLTEYDPCSALHNEDYSGPARFERISRSDDNAFYLIGEWIHTDICFDEMGQDHDFAHTSWDNGKLELSECVE